MTNSKAKMLEPDGPLHCWVHSLLLLESATETWCRITPPMVAAVLRPDGGQ